MYHCLAGIRNRLNALLYYPPCPLAVFNHNLPSDHHHHPCYRRLRMCLKKQTPQKLLIGCHYAVVKLSTQQDSVCHQHWMVKGYKNCIKPTQTFWSFKCQQHWLQWQTKLLSDSSPNLLKKAWVAKFQACDHHRSETCCLVSQYPPTIFFYTKET